MNKVYEINHNGIELNVMVSPIDSGGSRSGQIVSSNLMEQIAEDSGVISNIPDIELKQSTSLSDVIFVKALESLVLSHACAGIDVSSREYVNGIYTTIEAYINNEG